MCGVGRTPDLAIHRRHSVVRRKSIAKAERGMKFFVGCSLDPDLVSCRSEAIAINYCTWTISPGFNRMPGMPTFALGSATRLNDRTASDTSPQSPHGTGNHFASSARRTPPRSTAVPSSPDYTSPLYSPDIFPRPWPHPTLFTSRRRSITSTMCRTSATPTRPWPQMCSHAIGALRGRDVFFLTGLDEHGQKVQQAAAKAGIDPQPHCDKLAPQFQQLWKRLNISNDAFIRTTEVQHKTIVQRYLQELFDKQLIYKDSYTGWYCTFDERFWTEKDVADGLCPDCKRPVERLSEHNYFFKMGQYQDRLIELHQTPRKLYPS